MKSEEVLEELKALQKKYFAAIDEAFQAKCVLGEKIFETMRNDLFYRYEIERDQLKEVAKIPDKNLDFETGLKIYELTPHRRGFLWLFKNEARKLKEREVSADDRIELDRRTSDVETLEEKIYGDSDTNEDPKPWYKRLFKRRKGKPDNVQSEDPAANLQSKDPATEPEQPATMANGSPSDTATVVQPSELSAAAPGADVAMDPNNNNTGNTGNVAKPPAPAPTSEKPKRGRKRKQPAESTAEPSTKAPAPTTATTQPPAQLEGQIKIEELAGK